MNTVVYWHQQIIFNIISSSVIYFVICFILFYLVICTDFIYMIEQGLHFFLMGLSSIHTSSVLFFTEE